jgi:hypothetical protein
MVSQESAAMINTLTQRIKHTFRGWLLVSILAFLVLFVLGLAIYRDYGLGWDEPNQRFIGKSNYNYAFYGNQSLLNIGDRYYGPFYEVVLFALTNSPDSDQMYYLRHLWTFLTFAAGTIVFFLLIRKICRKDWLALIGWLALVLSPRIFADAFYNSKDIPFMVAFILAVYTMIRYLDHSSWKNLLLHALSSAILIAIRIPGVLVLAMTISFVLFDQFFSHNQLDRTLK